MGSPLVLNGGPSPFDAAIASGKDYYDSMNKSAAEKAALAYKAQRDQVGDARNAATDAEGVKVDDRNQANTDRTDKENLAQRAIDNKAAAKKESRDQAEFVTNQAKAKLEERYKKGEISDQELKSQSSLLDYKLKKEFGRSEEIATIEGKRLGNQGAVISNAGGQIANSDNQLKVDYDRQAMPGKIENDNIDLKNRRMNLLASGAPPTGTRLGGHAGLDAETLSDTSSNKDFVNHYKAQGDTYKRKLAVYNGIVKQNANFGAVPGKPKYQDPGSLPTPPVDPTDLQEPVQFMLERLQKGGNNIQDVSTVIGDFKKAIQPIDPKDPKAAQKNAIRAQMKIPEGVNIDPGYVALMERMLKKTITATTAAQKATQEYNSGGGSSANQNFPKPRGMK